ncbi:hypothetical protein EPO33_00495 [Patescibacteria group bacterium]|nr:MAG: hypothetical protein EPO33_00495 [Patescibacteria group bacterium]
MSSEHIKPRSDSVVAALEQTVIGVTGYPATLRDACNRQGASSALDRLRDALQRLHPFVRFHPVFPPDGSIWLPDARAVADHILVLMLEACGDVCPITGEPIARGYLDCATADAAAGHLASCEAHGRLFSDLVRSFARAMEFSGESDGFIAPYADALAEFRETTEVQEEDECGPFRVPLRCRDENGDPHVVYALVENIVDVNAIRHDCHVLGRDLKKVMDYVRHLEMYAQSMGCEALDSVLLEGARQYFYRLHNLSFVPPPGGSPQKT